MPRCPGQDQRYWTADDIFDVCCPYCDQEIEFWKDEPFRLCRTCMKEVRNPRIDLGCAKWCKYAKQCLGTLADTPNEAMPVIERLRLLLTKDLGDGDPRLVLACQVHEAAERLLVCGGPNPAVVKPAALLAGLLTAGRQGDLLPDTVQLREHISRKDLLGLAGVDPGLTGQIWQVVDAVRNGKVIETDEWAIVNQAISAMGPIAEAGGSKRRSVGTAGPGESAPT